MIEDNGGRQVGNRAVRGDIPISHRNRRADVSDRPAPRAEGPDLEGHHHQHPVRDAAPLPHLLLPRPDGKDAFILKSPRT